LGEAAKTTGERPTRQVEEPIMKATNLSAAVALMTLLPCACALAQPGTCGVTLTQDPLVMRLGKDEFRIAFGLDAAECKNNGCSGSIKYNATWQAEDGTRNSEQRSVGFRIPGGAERSLTTDRGYFDNGEAQHTTEVVSVDVADISCNPDVARDVADR
jgi:hypothetical protein